jgi:hypothetical protein
MHLKLLEKQEQVNAQSNRREIINIRTEINELETKRFIKLINETESNSQNIKNINKSPT